MTVRDARGHSEQIRTTAEHPFWVEGKGWTRAGSLTAGMRVEQPDGSAAYVVGSAAEAHPEGVRVYNFEVEGDHTYFVEAAKGEHDAVWVHNTCDLTGADGEPITGTAARRAFEEDLLQQQGMREISPPSNRGMQNPAIREAAENGDIEHALLRAQMHEKGWLVDRNDTAMVDPLTGETVYPDALTPRGRPIEIKPRSDTGMSSGQSQLPKYERATGMRGRVVYYDP